MGTFLFDKVVFGPVISRRLGKSLGINLLPANRKVCNFNCLYCECGLNGELGDINSKLPTRKQVAEALRSYLQNASKAGIKIDTITFAGNGEPTMHPQFHKIIDDTLEIRDGYLPNAKLAVLSNASNASNDKIFKALSKVDFNILKLDSAKEDTIRRINCPQGDFSYTKLFTNLKRFKTGLTIQTLFVRGEFQGHIFDNTQPDEIAAWQDALRVLRPELVMVYSISRDTPIQSIQKIEAAELESIANKVRALGLTVSVS